MGDGYAKGIVVINGNANHDCDSHLETFIVALPTTAQWLHLRLLGQFNEGFWSSIGPQDLGAIGAGSSDFSFWARGGDILWDSVHETIVVNSGSFVTVIAGNETSGSAVLVRSVPYLLGTVNDPRSRDPANGFVYEATTDPEEMVAINGTSVVSRSPLRSDHTKEGQVTWPDSF